MTTITYFEEAGIPQIETFNATGTLIALDGKTVPEGPGRGRRVGDLKTTVGGSPVDATYSLVSGPGSTHNRFFSVSRAGLFFEGTADHESLDTYSIRIRAIGDNLDTSQVFQIVVLDDRTEDVDGDGLTEAEEEDRYGTSDLLRDSDQDGLEDPKEVELAFGTDPSRLDLDPASFGLDSGEPTSPFDPARDDSQLIESLTTLGFFTAEDLVTLTPGALVIENNDDGPGFRLNLQMERWSEEDRIWFKEGEPIPWHYLPNEPKGLLRVVPKDAAE